MAKHYNIVFILALILSLTLSGLSILNTPSMETAIADEETDAQTGATPYQRTPTKEPEDYRDYYERARIYLKQKDYDAALNRLDHALELNPSFAEGYYVRGRVYMKLEDPLRAFSDFSNAIKNYKKDKRLLAASHYSRGQVLYNQGDYENAVQDYTQAIDLLQDALFYRARGLAYIELKEHEKALKDLEEASKLKTRFSPALQEELNRLRGLLR